MLSTTALQHVTGNGTVAKELSSDTVYQISDSVSQDTRVIGNAQISYHEYSGGTAASDVANAAKGQHTLPGKATAIVLDQEHWATKTCPGGRPCTSAHDRADPVKYAKQAAQAVQAYNETHTSAPLTLIVTPGLDLFSGGALGCGKTDTIARCYLSYNMAGKMAAIPGVSVIELQAQSLEGDPGTPGGFCPATSTAISYWCFVSQAAAQARAAAKKAGKTITVLAGLSTHPTTKTTPSECDIEQSASVVRSLVAGFWMNVPNPGAASYTEAEDVMLGHTCPS